MTREADADTRKILRFPLELRERPSFELLIRIAPSRSLVDMLIEERGDEPHDLQGEFACAFAHQAHFLGLGCGRDEAVLKLRHLVDAHIGHAIDLCRACQDAADRMIALEVQAARAERVPVPLRLALDGARGQFQRYAISARAAADGALGAASALATYVREEHSAAPISPAEPRQLLLFDKTLGARGPRGG